LNFSFTEKVSESGFILKRGFTQTLDRANKFD